MELPFATIRTGYVVFAIALVVLELYLRWRRRTKLPDWWWNGLFLYVIVYKLSYIPLHWTEFMSAPLSAVYFGGSHIAAALVVAVVYRKPLWRARNSLFAAAFAALLFTTVIQQWPEPKRVAPSFTLQSFSLDDTRGNVVVLNFWASWCPPCRAEMPQLQSFVRHERDVVFQAINVTARDDRAAAEQFLQERNITLPILFDERDTVAQQFNVRTIPTTIVIDERGQIIARHVGAIDEATLRQLMNR